MNKWIFLLRQNSEVVRSTALYHSCRKTVILVCVELADSRSVFLIIKISILYRFIWGNIPIWFFNNTRISRFVTTRPWNFSFVRAKPFLFYSEFSGLRILIFFYLFLRHIISRTWKLRNKLNIIWDSTFYRFKLRSTINQLRAFISLMKFVLTGSKLMIHGFRLKSFNIWSKELVIKWLTNICKAWSFSQIIPWAG